MNATRISRIFGFLAFLSMVGACASDEEPGAPVTDSGTTDVSTDRTVADSDASEAEASAAPDANGDATDEPEVVSDAAPDQIASDGNPVDRVEGDVTPCPNCASGLCLEGGACVQCLADDNCPSATPKCHPSTHSCVGCLGGGADSCAGGMYCDVNDFSCKTGCKTDMDCTVGVCSSQHACVECVPGNNDTCADGKYCNAQFACVRGCKLGGEGGTTGTNACTSGVCTSTHDCSRCQSDLECQAGSVCSTGKCMPPCSAQAACPSADYTCCGDHCVDEKRDGHSCGACGTVCAAGQFCANGCQTSTLANVCQSQKATFLLDIYQIDNSAAGTIQAALSAGCTPLPVMATASQDTSDAINTRTGRPVAGGGEMLVVAGGSFGQSLVRYLEQSANTPVYFDSTDTRYFFKTRAGAGVSEGGVPEAGVSEAGVSEGGAEAGADGGAGGAGATLVDVAQSAVTDTHSYFLVETVTEPTSGTLVLLVYGMSASGTQAAGWYFANVMFPTKDTLTKSWYVVEWQDGNADNLPNAGEFTAIASGP